jgi:DNA-binding NarL/FixJ family response regulator
MGYGSEAVVQTTEETKKIILVDDHALTREALGELVAGQKQFELIGEAESGEEAIELVSQLEPDILVMDMQMSGMSGLEATRKIIQAHPKTKILIVSNYTDSTLVKAAFQAGALGYISKQSAFEELIPAITAGLSIKYGGEGDLRLLR